MNKRLLLLQYSLILLLFLLFLQLYAITQNPTYHAFSETQSGKTTVLYQTRGQIYDRSFTSLTDAVTIRTAVIGDKTAPYAAPERDFSLAPHIIGYLSDGKGVTGIEAAYDTFLSKAGETATASIPTYGNGNVVPTAELILSQPTSPTAGVVLTLDADLQRICMDVGATFGKGAIVCMDAESGEILAFCSFPGYTDPAKALSDPDSPLYNRVLAAYPIGSVMKPVIAAAALETGFSPNMAYNCTGYITIGNTNFRCHNRAGHGTLNLYGAIANSCNPYFVQLTQTLSGETLLHMAQGFGLGQSVSLAAGITSASGTLPNSMTAGEKANFSFGQGKLTATPLQICAIYAAIANGGDYHTPTLVRGTTTDGCTLTENPDSVVQTAITKNTARILQQALYETVNNAKDSLAKSERVTICGKTGTAQTGRYESGEEVLIGWFAGWFERDGHTIAITVMAENAESGNHDAAPLVKQIAERY